MNDQSSTQQQLDELFSQARESEPYLDAEPFVERLQPGLDRADWPPRYLKQLILLFGAMIGSGIALINLPIPAFLGAEFLQQAPGLVSQFSNFITPLSLLLLFLTASLCCLLCWQVAVFIDRES